MRQAHTITHVFGIWRKIVPKTISWFSESIDGVQGTTVKCGSSLHVPGSWLPIISQTSQWQRTITHTHISYAPESSARNQYFHQCSRIELQKWFCSPISPTFFCSCSISNQISSLSFIKYHTLSIFQSVLFPPKNRCLWFRFHHSTSAHRGTKSSCEFQSLCSGNSDCLPSFIILLFIVPRTVLTLQHLINYSQATNVWLLRTP